MDYALINSETNIVENVIVLDPNSGWIPPYGYYVVSLEGTQAGIGWTYNPETQEWINPIPPKEIVNVDEVSGGEPNVIG